MYVYGQIRNIRTCWVQFCHCVCMLPRLTTLHWTINKTVYPWERLILFPAIKSSCLGVGPCEISPPLHWHVHWYWNCCSLVYTCFFFLFFLFLLLLLFSFFLLLLILPFFLLLPFFLPLLFSFSLFYDPLNLVWAAHIYIGLKSPSGESWEHSTQRLNFREDWFCLLEKPSSTNSSWAVGGKWWTCWLTWS